MRKISGLILLIAAGILIFSGIAQAAEVDYEKVKKGVEGFGEWAMELEKSLEGLNADDRVDKIIRDTAEYFSEYTDDELLVMEQEFFKKGGGLGYQELLEKGDETGHNVFGKEAVSSVLSERWKENPPFSKVLNEIILNKKMSDEMRKSWVVYINSEFYTLRSKKQLKDEMRNEVVNALIAVYNDEDNSVEIKAEAIGTIAGFGDGTKEIKQILKDVLDDPRVNDKIKVEAILKIRSFLYKDRDEEIIKRLVSIIEHHQNYSHKIFVTTLDTIAAIKEKRAIEPMIKILDTTEDIDLFETVAIKLKGFEDKSTIEPLFKNTQRFGMRIRDIWTLFDSNMLTEYAEDANAKFLKEAIEILGFEAHKQARYVLYEHLTHPNPVIRKESIKALGRMATDFDEEVGKEVVKTVKEKIEIEKDKEVKDSMQQEIERIERYLQRFKINRESKQ